MKLPCPKCKNEINVTILFDGQDSQRPQNERIEGLLKVIKELRDEIKKLKNQPN